MEGIPKQIVNRIREAAIDSAMRSEQMLKAQQEIIRVLNEKQISCAVLKGTSVACCYPHPELRVPGDIDLLIGSEKLEAATKVMSADGFKVLEDTDLHIDMQRESIEVELHRMASRYPSTEKGMWTAEYMEHSLQCIQYQTINGISFPVLSKPHLLISLLAHMSRHLCTCGIGLRQLCDWDVTLQRLSGSIDQEDVDLMEQCGLLRCASIMTRICEKYLGLPVCEWKQDVPEEIVDLAMTEILAMGNFHAQRDEEQVISSVFIDSRGAQGRKQRSIVLNYVHYVKKTIERSYPWAKSPLWIPLFCGYYPLRHMIRVLIGKRKGVNISKSIQIAKERANLERELKLYR